jgi:hypothetical protein
MKKPSYFVAAALLLFAGVWIILRFIRSRHVQPGFSSAQVSHMSFCPPDVPGGLEPRIVPGTTESEAVKFYGKPSKRDDVGEITWMANGYSVTDTYFGPDRGGNDVSVQVEPGHTISTVDGIVLGSDTFASVTAKLKASKIDFHESMDGPEGNWMLFVSFYLPCNPKFRAEYSWFLQGSPKIDQQIIPEEQGSIKRPIPWNSDVFLNKVVDIYSLSMANGSDIPAEGKSSTHRP